MRELQDKYLARESGAVAGTRLFPYLDKNIIGFPDLGPNAFLTLYAGPPGMIYYVADDGDYGEKQSTAAHDPTLTAWASLLLAAAKEFFGALRDVLIGLPLPVP